MAGPVLDLGLQGGRWQLYRDPPRPPPVGVAVEENGGDALMSWALPHTIESINVLNNGHWVVYAEP
jgi:hypothetical protein